MEPQTFMWCRIKSNLNPGPDFNTKMLLVKTNRVSNSNGPSPIIKHDLALPDIAGTNRGRSQLVQSYINRTKLCSVAQLCRRSSVCMFH